MPFKKGESGNPDGRPKGSLNKSTIAGAEQATAALEKMGGFDKVADLIDKLIEGGFLKEAANLMLKMSEFAYPKLKAVDMSTTIQDEREELTPEELEQRLKDLQDELQQFDDD